MTVLEARALGAPAQRPSAAAPVEPGASAAASVHLEEYQGGQVSAAVPEVGPAASAGRWIAWQVPSRVALAATPSGAQRALLKDALRRTLEANEMRMPPHDINVFLGRPQLGRRRASAAIRRL